MKDIAKRKAKTAATDNPPEVRTARLVAISQNRKQENRDRLLGAAIMRMSEVGYAAASIDDVAATAGLSRVTFYRHFKTKAALVTALFEAARADGLPRLFEIMDQDFLDPAVVRAWIARIFAAGRANSRLFSVFAQAAAAEPSFIAFAHHGMDEAIASLGTVIPAFALDPQASNQRHRWVEAWLLLYEILDQSNHTATHSGVANDPVVIDVLTERFIRFVSSSS